MTGARRLPVRHKFTGTVTVDVSGHVDADGWLTGDGIHALWYGLAGARGLPVRIDLGQMAHAPLSVVAVLETADDCEAVEVCGAEPSGVAEILAILRGAP
jgi:hypothetical protein